VTTPAATAVNHIVGAGEGAGATGRGHFFDVAFSLPRQFCSVIYCGDRRREAG
jgi:hypothetical protein